MRRQLVSVALPVLFHEYIARQVNNRVNIFSGIHLVIMHFRLCVSSICLPPASLQALTRKKFGKGHSFSSTLGVDAPSHAVTLAGCHAIAGPSNPFHNGMPMTTMMICSGTDSVGHGGT